MEIKTQREATRMTKVKKTNDATDWLGCEAPAAFTQWWLECAVYFGKQFSIFFYN